MDFRLDLYREYIDKIANEGKPLVPLFERPTDPALNQSNLLVRAKVRTYGRCVWLHYDLTLRPGQLEYCFNVLFRDGALVDVFIQTANGVRAWNCRSSD